MEIVVLIVVVAGVYFFASHKSRRSEAVESRIRRMVSAGVSSSSFPDLYFEAAKSYAISKDGRYGADLESASALIIIAGSVYSVVFVRSVDGGTIINAVRT